MELNWDDIQAYKYLKDKKSVFIGNIDKMIIYAELFQFCLLIVAIISLCLTHKKK